MGILLWHICYFMAHYSFFERKLTPKMQHNFPPIPSNATGPPSADYDASGEDKNDREPPGGYLGEKKHPNGKNPVEQGGGHGPVITEPVEPDPSEPDYSVSLP
jgi:hypothetical protein